MKDHLRLTLDRLVITDLRNLARVEVDPAARINVICGNNGQGKTSVLEAIYLLATSRSFRTARLPEVLRHGCRVGSARGTFREHRTEGDALVRRQSTGLEGGRRVVRIDGKPPPSLSYYATQSPVVVFDAQQLRLSSGPAQERRTLLDRITLFMQAELSHHRSRYSQALRGRQRLLAVRGPSWQRHQDPELDAYEHLLGVHGAAIVAARRRACLQLGAELTSAFAVIAAAGLTLGAEYSAAGSEQPEVAQERLAADRGRDARQRRTSFGPHRDDLVLTINGHPAQVVASQGQHRAITLALKTAEMACIARARGVQPILLLDDVSSELDAERTKALFTHLAATRSQIFLTTTRRDLIATPEVPPEARRDFYVEGGELAPAV